MNIAQKLIELYAPVQPEGFDWAKINAGDASRFTNVWSAPDRWKTGNPIADRQSKYLVNNVQQRKLDGDRYNDRGYVLKTTTTDNAPCQGVRIGIPEDADGDRPSADKERDYDGNGGEIADAQKDSMSQFSKPVKPTFTEDRQMDELDAVVQRILKLYENVPLREDCGEGYSTPPSAEQGGNAFLGPDSKDKTLNFAHRMTRRAYSDMVRKNSGGKTRKASMRYTSDPDYDPGERAVSHSRYAGKWNAERLRDKYGKKEEGCNVDEGRRLRTAAMAGMMGLAALGAGKAKAAQAGDYSPSPGHHIVHVDKGGKAFQDLIHNPKTGRPETSQKREYGTRVTGRGKSGMVYTDTRDTHPGEIRFTNR
jgi:hypothetical protein